METIKLDLIPGKKMPSLHASQYDDGRDYHIDLTENRAAYTLDGTETISLTVRKCDNTLVTMDIANTFANKSYIEFRTTEQMTACAGFNYGEIVLEDNGTRIGSLNFYLQVEGAPDEGGVSQSEINNLNRQIDDHIDEVLPDMVENIAPAIVEEVAPSVVREVAPAIVEDVAPSILERLAPSAVEDVAPSIVERLVPAEVADVAPAVVREVAPPIVEELVPIALGNNYYNKTQVDGIANTKANTNLDNISDGVISQPKLSFAEIVYSENLFNVADSNMFKKGYWYYGTTVGAVMNPTSNQYTTNYVAITIPSHGASKITLGCFPTSDNCLVYWIGAVDKDKKLLTYLLYNARAPITYTMPANAEFLIVSIQSIPSKQDYYLNNLVAVDDTEITEYIPYTEPYYILNGCKCEALETNRIASIKLPDHYDLVVGDTFELFYKGIINAVNPECFDIDIQCSIGNSFARKFVVTPSTAGDVPIIIGLYDYEHRLIESKQITLNVHAKATSPIAQKNILCVGDSLTQGGQWVKELARRLTASGGTPEGDNLNNINFIGTCEVDGVHFEGYGGWSFYYYNRESVSSNVKVITCSHDKTEAQDQHSIYQDGAGGQWKLETINNDNIKIILVSGTASSFPSTGTLTWVSGGVNHSNIVYTASANASGNPFWDNNAGKVDFGSYATRLGVSSIDYVVVLLGWNNAGDTKETNMTEAQTFIDNVHASFPNAKIVLSGLEIPARDGLGNNYSASSAYSLYFNLMQYVHNLDDWYKELAEDNTGLSNFNLSGQFDTEYNMPTSTRAVNIRNATTEAYQSNGIHPATSGYLQIADAVYRHITTLL